MSLRFPVVLLLAAAALAVGSQVRATPIQKVTELLKGLQAKITEEGKKEAAAYDKFACFCKEQADEKLYAIEKSNELISKLSAQIKELDTDISSLNGEISELSKTASAKESKIEKEANARAKDNADYVAKAKDLNEAIGACVAAIQTMKDARGGLKNAKVTNLAQVLPAETLALMQKLRQEPAKYQFQGNDIIATLESLKADFDQMKKELDQDEFDINSVFEKEALGDTNGLKFTNKEKDEKAALAEEKTEEVMKAREARSQETSDRDADQTFLDTVTAECEQKAGIFDQRSSTRSQELSAMTDAIAQLEEGVKPNEGANGKLVGLVQAPSFLQQRTIRTLQQDSNRAIRKVQELLQEAAGRLDSAVLKGAAARVEISADHFVKVRGLIKDLIAKLEADAKAEAEQKSFCDKAMTNAISNRDEGKMKQEGANSELASLTAEKEDLTNAIADLNQAVADNKKALNEATELRNDEKEGNEKTLEQANQGNDAVKMAMSILNDFYKNAFVQTSSKYTPPKADRSGKTVGDLAPETAGEEYHGASGESKGIIGIMEVIQSDFERTIKQTTSDEKDAQAAFEKFEKETTDDSTTMSNTINKKEGELKAAEANILDQQQELKDATDLFESGVNKLDDLKAACVEGEETNEERVAARKKEVEALKEAMTVLNEWQGN